MNRVLGFPDFYSPTENTLQTASAVFCLFFTLNDDPVIKMNPVCFLLMFILFDYYLNTLEEIMKHLEGQHYAIPSAMHLLHSPC